MKTITVKIITGKTRGGFPLCSFSYDLPTGHGTVSSGGFNHEFDAEKAARASLRSLDCTCDFAPVFDFVKATAQAV
jgi:hypothetical protein